MKRQLILVGLVQALALGAVWGAPADIKSGLQIGLFEEEANRDLEAAIRAYQGVVRQHEEQRQYVATAVFRLGECYRKLGRTNDAVAQYQRLLQDFSEQESLVGVSRRHLKELGAEAPVLPTLTEARREQRRLLEEEIKLLERQAAAVKLAMNAGRSPASAVTEVERELLQLRRQLVALDAGLEPAVNASPARIPGPDEEASEIRSVRELIRNSPDLINAKTGPVDQTRLHSAAERGRLEVARFLLSNGAQVNARDLVKRTPLHYSAQGGHLAMVELLLESGAEVNARDEAGFTPVHRAVERGFHAVVEALMRRGADPGLASLPETSVRHSIGGTSAHAGQLPVQTALIAGYPELAELLIRRGAKADERNSAGETPLHVAVAVGNAGVAALLIERGADIQARDASGATPLHTATSHSAGTNLVAWLLERGAEVDATMAGGYAPLHVAAREGSSNVVRLLLARGANPNRIDEGGNTPLMLAARHGALGSMQALLENQADPNLAGPDGVTPLSLAIAKDNHEIVKLLLARQADLNARSVNGRTPLHDAVAYGREEMVELLLEAGADPNLPDANGQTPLDYLKKGVRIAAPGQFPPPVPSPRPTALAEILRQHGALEWTPRPGQITLVRRSAGVEVVAFLQGTNGHNRCTVLEALARAEWGQQETRFTFPDLSRITVLRAIAEEAGLQETVLDLRGVAVRVCTNNIWLEWGDLVEIPERTHKLDERWLGLPGDFAYGISDVLRRMVSLRVANVETNLSVTAEPSGPRVEALRGQLWSHEKFVEQLKHQRIVQGVIFYNPASPDIREIRGTFFDPQLAGGRALFQFTAWVALHDKLEDQVLATGRFEASGHRPVAWVAEHVERFSWDELYLHRLLPRTGLLLSTSDLSRVQVRRTLETGARREWMFDLTATPASDELLLREGDVIVVPDK